jgi:hypothetical protein
MYNLVIILGKEEGTSYNKTAELVNQMLIDKLDEVQSAIIELRALPQNSNDITPSQIAAIEQYIIRALVLSAQLMNIMPKVLVSSCDSTWTQTQL